MYDGKLDEYRETAASSGPTGRLAIVSTFDELCGIAGVTKAIVPLLAPHLAEVKVFDLDQFLLRHTNRRVEARGDLLVREIAKSISSFDSVNIQLEYGTLGKTTAQILRRFRWIAEAAPALSVTFHTILDEASFSLAEAWEDIARGRPAAAMKKLTSSRRNGKLGRGINRILRRQAAKKPVHLIAHNRRDARLLRDVHGFSNVHHHPLSYISAERARDIRRAADRTTFPGIASLPKDSKLIGTFGFLSPYKGFETAIQALRYLPEEYHLVIFGGIHPQSIQKNSSRDSYIDKLFAEANIGKTVFDDLGSDGRRGAGNLSVAVNVAQGADDILTSHPHDLRERVHFMGVLSDEQFYEAMAICDCVALPYQEVGQSSSGPISMALEMSCRIIASRTKTFLQYAKYFPAEIEFADIGNYVEFASRIRSKPHADPLMRVPAFNTVTNTGIYLKANPALNLTIPANAG